MRVRILANISFALAGLLAALESSRVAMESFRDAVYTVRLQRDNYPVHCRIVRLDAGLADAMAAGEQIASRGINPAPYRIRPACAASALAATIAAHTTRFCRMRLAAAPCPATVLSTCRRLQGFHPQ